MADNGKGHPSAPNHPNVGMHYQQQYPQGYPQPPPGGAPAYGNYGAQGGMPPGPPPPYSPAGMGGYPQAQGHPQAHGHPQAAPMGAPPPYAAHGYGYPAPQGPQTTLVMPTGFDSGARFDNIARPNIPPPPPGVAPNAAQMAMMQGQNVVMGQKKESFLTGGKGGGYTFW